MVTKKVLNKPAAVVDEFVSGLVAVHGERKRKGERVGG
jgi:hypothetical protein